MRLFISYAHANRTKVEELQNLLTKIGNEIWFDSDLSGGEKWWDRILDEIEKCEIFIFALSPESTDSAACRAEFQYALDLNKPILPVLLKTAELPIGQLQQTQFVDTRKLNKNDTVLALTRSLLNLQKQISLSQYQLPDPRPLRPEFPFAADPLKEIREAVKNLGNISEAEIVALVFRIKQVARLGNRTSRESRQLLQSIMTSQHVPHSIALEARDALTALPSENRPLWIYGSAVAAVVIIIVLILLINVNQERPHIDNNNAVSSGATEITIDAATTTIASTTLMTTLEATSTSSISLSPTGIVIPTSVANRELIKNDSIERLTELHTFGRGLPAHMRLSPDGQTIAVSTAGGSIWLVDAQNPTSQPVELKGHSRWTEPIAFSHDSKTVASGSSDSTIRLWDVETGTQISVITEYDSWVRALVFSEDGKTLYAGGCWNTTIWDVNDLRNPIRIGEPIVAGGFCINTLALDSQKSVLAMSYGEGKISLVDLKSGMQTELPAGHTGYIRTLTFSPDGTTLVSGSTDNTIRFWDVAKLQPAGTPIAPDMGDINSIIFTPDGKQLVIGSGANAILVWNISDLNNPIPVNEPLTGHHFEVLDVVLDANGKQFISVSFDGTLRFWDRASQKQIGDPHELFTPWSQGISFSQDSQRIAAGYDDGTVMLLDVETGTSTKIGQHTSIGRVTTAFSPKDNNLLATRGGDNKILLWNLANLDQPPITLERRNPVDAGCTCRSTLMFSPDGSLIAAAFGGSDQSIHIWDISDLANPQELSGTLKSSTKDIRTLAFSPDGKLIAAGGEDNTITIWDWMSRTTQCILIGHTDIVRAVTFTSDGKYIISGSSDKAIRIWDSQCKGEVDKPIIQLIDQNASITSLTANPDPKNPILVSASTGSDNLWIWNIQDVHKPIHESTLSDANSVYAVTFSPDGTLLSASGDSGLVRLWSIAKTE